MRKPIDPTEVVGREFDVHRSKTLLQTLQFSRARHRNDPGPPGQQPGESDLRRGRPRPCSDVTHQINDGQVGLPGFPRTPRKRGPNVGRVTRVASQFQSYREVRPNRFPDPADSLPDPVCVSDFVQLTPASEVSWSKGVAQDVETNTTGSRSETGSDRDAKGAGQQDRRAGAIGGRTSDSYTRPDAFPPDGAKPLPPGHVRTKPHRICPRAKADQFGRQGVPVRRIVVPALVNRCPRAKPNRRSLGGGASALDASAASHADRRGSPEPGRSAGARRAF